MGRYILGLDKRGFFMLDIHLCHTLHGPNGLALLVQCPTAPCLHKMPRQSSLGKRVEFNPSSDLLTPGELRIGLMRLVMHLNYVVFFKELNTFSQIIGMSLSKKISILWDLRRIRLHVCIIR